MEALKKQYEDDIYRPGEDVSHLAHLTDAEKTERRREIEEIFNNPDAFIVARFEGDA